jgi:hypothetical protein
VIYKTPPNPPNEPCVADQQGNRDRQQENFKSGVLIQDLFDLLVQEWVRYRCPVRRSRQNIGYVIVDGELPLHREKRGAQIDFEERERNQKYNQSSSLHDVNLRPEQGVYAKSQTLPGSVDD